MYKYILLLLLCSTSAAFANPTEKHEIYKLDAESLKSMAEDQTLGAWPRLYACKKLARLGQHIDVAIPTMLSLVTHDDGELRAKAISTLVYSPHVTDEQTNQVKLLLKKWTGDACDDLKSKAALALLDLDITLEEKKELEQILQVVYDDCKHSLDVRNSFRALNYLCKTPGVREIDTNFKVILKYINALVICATRQKSIDHQKVIVECLNNKSIQKIICDEPKVRDFWINVLNDIIVVTTHETVKTKAWWVLLTLSGEKPEGNWFQLVRSISDVIKATTKPNNKLFLLKNISSYGAVNFDDGEHFDTFFTAVSHAEYDGRYDPETMDILDKLAGEVLKAPCMASPCGSQPALGNKLRKIEALYTQIIEKAKPIDAKIRAFEYFARNNKEIPLKVFASLLELGQHAVSFDVRLRALDAVWKKSDGLNDVKRTIVRAYVEIALSTIHPEIAVKAISAVGNSEYLSPQNRQSLVALQLKIIKEVGPEELRLAVFRHLWRDDRARDAHRDALVDGFFEIWPTASAEAYNDVFAIYDEFMNSKQNMLASQMDKFLRYIIGALTNLGYDVRHSMENAILCQIRSEDPLKKAGVLKLIIQIAHKMKDMISAGRLKVGEMTYGLEYIEFWQKKEVPADLEQTPKFTEQLAELMIEMIEAIASSRADIAYPDPQALKILQRLYTQENIRKKYLGRICKIHLHYQKVKAEKKPLKAFEHLVTDEFNSDLAELFEYSVHYCTTKDVIDQVQEFMKKASIPAHYHPHLMSGLVKRIKGTEFPTDDNLEAYIVFGHPFQVAFNDYMNGQWRLTQDNTRRDLLVGLADKYGDQHPVLQGLIWLHNMWVEGNPRAKSPEIYEDLINKIKQPYMLLPARSSFNLALDDNTLEVKVEVDPKVFTYVPATQKALADLADVDLILGDKVEDDIAKVRAHLDFTKYFVAPFGEEALMLQALVKKYKFMGKAGRTRLCKLMTEMQQCKTGKNLAVSENYKVESKPLVEAELKHVMTWARRLENDDNPLLTEAESIEAFTKSRKDAATLIQNMMKPGHHFRQHLTDLPYDDAAKLMRGLLGRFVEGEAGAGLVDIKERAALKKSLIQVVGILLELQDPKTFFTHLSRLCRDYEVALPANKYEQNLSESAIEGLIQKMKASDVDGLGELVALQNEMRDFMKKPDVKALIDNLTDEEGVLFRELMDGYVSNGWAAGFMKLVMAAREDPLNKAVNETHMNTRIDKDLPLNWDTLKKVILREISTIKRDCLHNLVLKYTSQVNQLEHTLEYAEGLLGGVIGMRPADKMPDFDLYASCVVEEFKKLSLQEALSVFEELFTPQRIIEHLKFMIKNNQLNVIDPMTGKNMIWVLLSQVAQDYLVSKKIDEYEATQIVLGEGKNDANDLAIALMLKKIGLLREVE